MSCDQRHVCSTQQVIKMVELDEHLVGCELFHTLQSSKLHAAIGHFPYVLLEWPTVNTRGR